MKGLFPSVGFFREGNICGIIGRLVWNFGSFCSVWLVAQRWMVPCKLFSRKMKMGTQKSRYSYVISGKFGMLCSVGN